MRSGWRGRSARLVQMCGVTQFWFARYTSVAASLARTCVSVPPRFGTVTRRIQSGKCRGTSFAKKPGPSTPCGNDCMATGWSRTSGAIAGATRS